MDERLRPDARPGPAPDEPDERAREGRERFHGDAPFSTPDTRRRLNATAIVALLIGAAVVLLAALAALS